MIKKSIAIVLLCLAVALSSGAKEGEAQQCTLATCSNEAIAIFEESSNIVYFFYGQNQSGEYHWWSVQHGSILPEVIGIGSHPSAVYDQKGTVYAMWSNNNIRFKIFNGTEWLPGETVADPPTGSYQRPHLAVDTSGNILAVWIWKYDTNNNLANKIVYSLRNATTKTWSSPLEIATFTADVTPPLYPPVRIAFSTQRAQPYNKTDYKALVVWPQVAGVACDASEHRIAYAVWDGNSWSQQGIIPNQQSPAVLSPPLDIGIAPYKNKNVGVTWTIHNTDPQCVTQPRVNAWFVQWNATAETWTTPLSTDTAQFILTANSNSLAVTQNDDIGFSVYTYSDPTSGGGSELRWSKHPPNAASSSLGDFADTFHFDMKARIAALENDQAIVVWANIFGNSPTLYKVINTSNQTGIRGGILWAGGSNPDVAAKPKKVCVPEASHTIQNFYQLNPWDFSLEETVGDGLVMKQIRSGPRRDLVFIELRIPRFKITYGNGQEKVIEFQESDKHNHDALVIRRDAQRGIHTFLWDFEKEFDEPNLKGSFCVHQEYVVRWSVTTCEAYKRDCYRIVPKVTFEWTDRSGTQPTLEKVTAWYRMDYGATGLGATKNPDSLTGILALGVLGFGTVRVPLITNEINFTAVRDGQDGGVYDDLHTTRALEGQEEIFQPGCRDTGFDCTHQHWRWSAFERGWGNLGGLGTLVPTIDPMVEPSDDTPIDQNLRGTPYLAPDQTIEMAIVRDNPGEEEPNDPLTLVNNEGIAIGKRFIYFHEIIRTVKVLVDDPYRLHHAEDTVLWYIIAVNNKKTDTFMRHGFYVIDDQEASHRGELELARDKILNLTFNENPSNQTAIVQLLNESIRDEYWQDNNTLNTAQGENVFLLLSNASQMILDARISNPHITNELDIVAAIIAIAGDTIVHSTMVEVANRFNVVSLVNRSGFPGLNDILANTSENLNTSFLLYIGTFNESFNNSAQSMLVLSQAWRYAINAAINDTDNDVIPDERDNCPLVKNDQLDSDRDTLGDVCDPCPLDSTNVCDTTENNATTIGIHGGTVIIPSNNAEINILRDAMEADQTVFISGDINLTGFNTSIAFPQTLTYTFGPSADLLTLNESAILMLRYNESAVINESNLILFFWNESSNSFEQHDERCDIISNACSINLSHLTKLIIGEKDVPLSRTITSCTDDPNIPGVWTVVNDINTTGTCLEPLSDDIIINCNGYTITGSNLVSGIEVIGRNNITIEHCYITAFSKNIFFDNTTNSTIHNTTALSAVATGMHLSSSHNNNLVSISSTSVSGHGIRLQSSSGNTLDNVSGTAMNSRTSGFAGIALDAGTNANVLTDVDGRANNGVGLLIDTASYNNTLFDASGRSDNHPGIRIAFGFDNNIINSTGMSDVNSGIFFDQSNNNVMIGSSGLSGTSGILSGGIVLHQSNDNTLINNTGTSNSSTYGNGGIYLEQSSANILSNNTGISSNSQGIALNVNSNNNIFINNHGESQTQFGILITGNSFNNTFLDNTGSSITGFGFSGGPVIRSTLINNTGISNTSYGLRITDTDTGYFENNTGISNTGVGMSFENVNNSRVLDNYGESQSSTGFDFAACADNQGTRNTGSGTIGMNILASTNNTFSTSTGVGFTSSGIRLQSSTFNTLMNSTGTTNSIVFGDAGILLESSSGNTLLNNTGQSTNSMGIVLNVNSNNNLLSGNQGDSSTSFGIHITANSNNNVVINNAATSNSSFGFNIGSPIFNLTFTDNTGVSNALYGISISDTSTSSFIDNTGSSQQTHGFFFSTGSANTFTNNKGRTSSTSGGIGMVLINLNDSLIENNTGSSTNTAGIQVQSCHNNSFTGNMGIGGSQGMYFGGCSTNTFLDNTAAGNVTALLLTTSGEGSTNNQLTGTVLHTAGEWLVTDALSTGNTLTNTRFDASEGSIHILPLVSLPGSVSVNLLNLNISHNKNFLNSSALPFLNVSAQLMFHNLSWRSPIPTVDVADRGLFVECDPPLCTQPLYLNGTLSYEVREFTTYSSRERNRATMTIEGTPRLGNTINFTINDSSLPQQDYIFLMGITGTAPGLQLGDGRIVPINFDGVTNIVLFFGNFLGFSNVLGRLDDQGIGKVSWTIPPITELTLLPRYYATCVTWDGSRPLPEAVLSICQPPVDFTIAP